LLAIGCATTNDKGLSALIPERWAVYSFHLWDVAGGNGRVLYTSLPYMGGSGPTTIAFSPQSERVAFESYNSIRLWKIASNPELEISYSRAYTLPTAIELATGQTLPTLAGMPSLKNARTFIWSPDWTMFATDVYETNSNAPKLRLIDSQSGNELRTIGDHQVPMSFSHNGKMLLSRSWFEQWQPTNPIILSEVESGKTLLQLDGNFGYRPGVTFSPDDTLVASQGNWQIISQAYIWEVRSGKKYTLNTGYNGTGSIAFSPDGRLLAIGMDDGTVQIWGVKP
jgi:WD40 repeat protein